MRSVLKDISIGLFVCFSFFFVVEAALRVAQVGIRAPDEDPFVGFSTIQPLFKVENGVATVSPPRLKYFNEISFPIVKSPKTMRIFCFGGSTTYGHPFDHRSSFSRWLQDLLEASEADRTFEVLNVGGISYASYRIVPLIRETLQYKPDLMIIYTGHNEFLESRTYSGILNQGSGLIAVMSLLEQLKFYQVLNKFLSPLVVRGDTSQSRKNKDAKSSKWVLGGEVNAMLDRSSGLDLYHRDEEFSRGVVLHFAHNLRTMISLCRKAAVPVILVDPPSNLKDFSPFKSEHEPALTHREQVTLDGDIRRATQMIDRGEFSDAVLVLNKTISKAPLYAQSYYLRGRAFLALGQHPEAGEDFVKARDLDVCPLRCISPIEEQIVNIAYRERISRIPFRESVAKRASNVGDRSGIPGNESFLDHVHPTIELHQLLAGSLLDNMIEQGLVKASRKLSDEDRTAIFENGMRSFDLSFLALRDFNLAKTLKWAGKAEEAREALKRAAAKMDDNPEIHKMLGSFYLDDGRYEEGIQEYVRAVQDSGNDPNMEFDLAVAYYRSGQKEKASTIYEKILEKNHSMAEAIANLGIMHLENGNIEQALDILERGLQNNPQSSALFAPYALALAISGKAVEAVPWMLRAVEAEPGDPNHLYNLAGMYALTGRKNDAFKFLHLAVDKGYSNRDKLAHDGIFDCLRGQSEFQKILERVEK